MIAMGSSLILQCDTDTLLETELLNVFVNVYSCQNTESLTNPPYP